VILRQEEIVGETTKAPRKRISCLMISPMDPAGAVGSHVVSGTEFFPEDIKLHVDLPACAHKPR